MSPAKSWNFLQNGVLNFAFRLSQSSQESRWKIKICADEKPTIMKGT